jgi:hypothetical protein
MTRRARKTPGRSEIQVRDLLAALFYKDLSLQEEGV